MIPARFLLEVSPSGAGTIAPLLVYDRDKKAKDSRMRKTIHERKGFKP
jgi:hypothetical protein